MSVYRVTGTHSFREHKPGDVFEATLEPDEEARAVQRGNIEVVKHIRTGLQAGSWVLPTRTHGRDQ